MADNGNDTYVILHDKGGVYADNTTISAKSLVQDYKDGLNEVEDNDTLKWMRQAIEHNYYDDVIAFIASAWEMTIERQK